MHPIRKEAEERTESVLTRYLNNVQSALLGLPSIPTESNIQLWLSRLDDLISENRHSELPSFERWLSLSFGYEGEATPAPIDLRLHFRLGMLHRDREEYSLAREQLTLAGRAAPRDIYAASTIGRSHDEAVTYQSDRRSREAARGFDPSLSDHRTSR